jgi:hypothetical protein
MTMEKTNPITRHEVTIMPPTAQQLEPFGWIRLLNGNADAGYAHLDSQLVPKNPNLGGGGTYIVTAMPFEAMAALLSVLRNERNLQIRYFDPQAAGVSPSVFIETASTVQVGGSALRVPQEIATDIEKLFTTRR